MPQPAGQTAREGSLNQMCMVDHVSVSLKEQDTHQFLHIKGFNKGIASHLRNRRERERRERERERERERLVLCYK